MHAADVLRTLHAILLRGGVLAAVARRSAALQGVESLHVPGEVDAKGEGERCLLGCFMPRARWMQRERGSVVCLDA